jgi:hypothetical protein
LTAIFRVISTGNPQGEAPETVAGRVRVALALAAGAASGLAFVIVALIRVAVASGTEPLE